MIESFVYASLPLLTAAIFLAMYLAVVLVLVVLYVVRRRGHDAALGPLSPG
jgi:flagellar biogenesis protein FliO